MMDKQTEKKSERIEIRLPYTKKKNFINACDEQGDTPSHALRRFINSYTRRANADNMTAAMRSINLKAKRNWRRTSFISATAIVGLVGVWSISGFVVSSYQTAQNKVLFSTYDVNNNGRIDRGEISENDEDLHRVLDIDGELGISQLEFYSKGKMIWRFGEPSTFEVKKDHRGVLVQRTRTVQTLSLSDKNEFNPTIVTFDLMDPKAIELTAWKQASRADFSKIGNHQRSVVWVRGQNNPVHVIGRDFKLAKVNQVSE